MSRLHRFDLLEKLQLYRDPRILRVIHNVLIAYHGWFVYSRGSKILEWIPHIRNFLTAAVMPIEYVVSKIFLYGHHTKIGLWLSHFYRHTISPFFPISLTGHKHSNLLKMTLDGSAEEP